MTRWEWMTEKDESGEQRGIPIPPQHINMGWLLGGWEFNPKFEGHIVRGSS
jgi:hypothetical protein